jgi:hypothetical protein
MPTTDHNAVDQAVMIASRRERNFEPELVTVTLHTTDGPISIEGRPCHQCPATPAPGWPELHLPTYTFAAPWTGLQPTVDLETFTMAFDRELSRPDATLILTVHADTITARSTG